VVIISNSLNITVTDLSKFSFTNRAIPIRNSLSNHVVSADTINTLENSIWSNQEVLYVFCVI